MTRVDLSEDTYLRLLRRASSFSDTPEDVIRRLLDETEHSPDQSNVLHNVHRAVDEQPPPQRAIPGSILAEREYWRPILEIIDESGGSAAATDVIETLGDHMEGLLKPRDYEKLTMGEVRWRNRARFARLRMTEQGLLSSTSHRGVWELTDAGRRYLKDDNGARSHSTRGSSA
jgi:hypothetical protein